MLLVWVYALYACQKFQVLWSVLMLKKFGILMLVLFCGVVYGQAQELTPTPDPVSTATAPVVSSDTCDYLQGVLNLCDFAIREQQLRVGAALTALDVAEDAAADAYATLIQSYMVVPYDEEATASLRVTWFALQQQATVKRDAYNAARDLLSLCHDFRDAYQIHYEHAGCLQALIDGN